ncbi:MAG: DUF4976 domain-containing protein [Bacteroidetes bacterium]|nr:MAG: DUF4976 domain-containing protein [Bacteroidota bacterium]
MRLFPLLILSVSLLACQEPAPADRAPRPNIIYLMADDLGIGDIGPYGQTRIQTPNIDRLASEGIRFTQHYAGTSVCAPSRAVLMTGLHMGHVPVRGNRQDEPSGQFPLPDSSVTVAELLKQAGYVTGMIGKWGLGEPGTSGDPNEQGWDYFYGYTDQVLAHNYYPEYLWENGEKRFLDNEVRYLDTAAWHKGYGSYSTRKGEYSNDLFTEKALAFLEAHQAEPFFLYLPYTIPHNNGEALPGQKQEVPDYGPYAGEDWASDTLGYAAMITRLDSYVGQLRAKLAELGLAENTLFVFTSDNGPMQAQATGFTGFFDSNGPYRGFKRDLYEGGIRMPFLAVWPGTIKPGTETGHMAAFYDFLPTACELAGVPAPAYVDGHSYLPVLKGEAAADSHAYLYWEFYEGGRSQAIRQGKWKAVRTGLRDDPGAPWELYDLAEDPGETADLAASHPVVVARLDSLAAVAHRPDPAWPLMGL